jgi:hypothetical protein
MSESLAPEGDLPRRRALRMAEEASKVCSYHKRPEPLTAFASNSSDEIEGNRGQARKEGQ